jgi:hypothetical protein
MSARRHSDPDNSGMCIYCGWILDDPADDDDEIHIAVQHDRLRRERGATTEFCGAAASTGKDTPE